MAQTAKDFDKAYRARTDRKATILIFATTLALIAVVGVVVLQWPESRWWPAVAGFGLAWCVRSTLEAVKHSNNAERYKIP